MGNQNQKERLLRYIDQAKVEKLKQILKMSPNLLNKDLASDILQTPLVRAVWRNDMNLAQIILNFGANPNEGGSASITPLMWAYKETIYNQFLYQFNLELILTFVQTKDFSALDYSILHGNYRPAHFLFEFIQSILQFSSYYQFAQDNDYRYVNYEIMITHLKLKTEYQFIPNIYEKPKKIIIT
ncbi:unnamed protein product [Paramecium octaurelia]|uniref:Ankyrin repeat protein n=1 Tax=Paramecium octaurelia TaxID=43137 RepID=A0A8S1WKT7_PAROT|nr:unnamed protein product [Paramecium octaurelia]